MALIVTRVTPDHLTDPSLPSLLDFAQQVAELTERWSPSIWRGGRGNSDQLLSSGN
jgi:exodeoxyribonuclease-1